jgi:hypothetical protein
LGVEYIAPEILGRTGRTRPGAGYFDLYMLCGLPPFYTFLHVHEMYELILKTSRVDKPG